MPSVPDQLKKDRMEWCVKRLSDPEIRLMSRAEANETIRTECHRLFGRGISSRDLRKALRKAKDLGLMTGSWLSVRDAASYYMNHCDQYGISPYFSTHVSLLHGLRKESQRGNLEGSRKTSDGRWLLSHAGLKDWIAMKHGTQPSVVFGVDDTEQLALTFNPTPKPKKTRFTVAKTDPVAMLQEILQQNQDLKSENEALRSRIEKLEQVEQAVKALSNQLS